MLQVYIKSDCGVKNHSLCAFKRISLAKGESKEVSVTVPQSAFETVDENGVRSVKDGSYTIYAGFTQPTELSERLYGGKCVAASRR